MATPKSASAILTALRAEGLDVYGYGNWQDHNRNHKGPFGQVHGVMIHHTVTKDDDSSVALCYNGHSQLPGPLCHGVGRNDGRIALVGHGRANHAGLGDDDVLRAVIAEQGLPPDNEANTDGNRHFHGLEIVNLGDGKDTYPWKQYVAAVKWATAHCRLYGWNERSVIGHHEWQPGKIDPKGPVVGPDGKVFQFDMNTFRAHVRKALALPAGAWATDREEEEIMAISDADAQKIATAVIYRTIVNPARLDSEGNPKRTPVYAFLRSEDAHYDKTTERLNRLAEKVDAVAEAVGRVSVGGVDLDALAAKVADELQRRLQS